MSLVVISVLVYLFIFDDEYVCWFGGVVWLYGLQVFECFVVVYVCVIGIGGVGLWVVEVVVCCGVGKFILIDFDYIVVLNINWQIYVLGDVYGMVKVDVMVECILQINLCVEISCIDDFVMVENVEVLFGYLFDYVIDVIDVVKVKMVIIVFCKCIGKCVVMCGVVGG